MVQAVGQSVFNSCYDLQLISGVREGIRPKLHQKMCHIREILIVCLMANLYWYFEGCQLSLELSDSEADYPAVSIVCKWCLVPMTFLMMFSSLILKLSFSQSHSPYSHLSVLRFTSWNLTTRCLVLTVSGSVGECDRLSPYTENSYSYHVCTASEANPWSKQESPGGCMLSLCNSGGRSLHWAGAIPRLHPWDTCLCFRQIPGIRLFSLQIEQSVSGSDIAIIKLLCNSSETVGNVCQGPWCKGSPMHDKWK